MNEISRIQKIIPIVNEVSPTFCLAKWHHTTIYLQSGQTHSCYHPRPHAIPLDLLAQDPSVLHNTPGKRQERQMMVDGKRPNGCQYCWNIEDLPGDHVSDRHERNASIYIPERLGAIVKDPLAPVNPEYIEISFGNECNFKCGYCHPKHSSAYYKEIKDFGPYTMVKNHRNDIDYLHLYEEETNPYVDAWWAWWPEVSKTLNILRITGGEPLLQQSTWRLLDDLYINPKPNLELNINSNLGIKPVMMERLVTKVNALLNENKIKHFKLFTSIDTWGAPAEYIRTGLDLTVWEKNLDTYLTKTKQPITFMCTFNILTVTNFSSLLVKIKQWRKKYNGWFSRKQRIRFDTPYLKEPLQYDMNLLPKEQFMPYMEISLEYMRRNKFSTLECEKFSRVVEYMRNTNYDQNKIDEGRADFYKWFTEYDRRRNTSFENTFPELAEFYHNCAKVSA